MVTLLSQQISAHGRSSSNINGGPELDRCLSPEGSSQSDVTFIKEVIRANLVATPNPPVLSYLPKQGGDHVTSLVLVGC